MVKVGQDPMVKVKQGTEGPSLRRQRQLQPEPDFGFWNVRSKDSGDKT